MIKTLFGLSIIEQAKALAQQIVQVSDEDERIEVINQVRLIIHLVCPLGHHPVDFMEWVPEEQVKANDYNPNKMSPPERKLLEKSLLDNGYAMPVVVMDEEKETTGKNEKDGKNSNSIKTIVDGFHKSDLGKNSKAVRKQTKGYLPVCHIRPGRWALTDRMAATIQFNAHGAPSVQGLSDLVLKYARKGWSDERIAKELVWEPDKVLRLRQQLGLADTWKDGLFREAWTIVEGEALSEALKGPRVNLVVCADWGEKKIVVEKETVNQYSLYIDDRRIRKDDEKDTFISVREVEEKLQQWEPSYQIDSPIWYDGSYDRASH